MPQVFKIGSYWVYFWTNENKPLEPIHVHVSEGKPTENATKIWITQSGNCLLSKIYDLQKKNQPLRPVSLVIIIICSCRRFVAFRGGYGLLGF